MPARPHTVYAGTSGWAYASWKPGFYPAKTAAARMLEYYASQLNSVEVNFTFRQLPSEKQLMGWLSAAPEGFRFSFKAPQTITHIKRLRDAGDALAALHASLQPAEREGKLGAVLFQLPPNFKADAERLKAFLEETSKLTMRTAFEFRHASWFDEPIYAALECGNAALCIAESDELKTPERRTADFLCYRLRRSEYSESELAAMAQGFAKNALKGDVYAYFMHEDAPGRAAAGARRAGDAQEVNTTAGGGRDEGRWHRGRAPSRRGDGCAMRTCRRWLETIYDVTLCCLRRRMS